MNIGQIKSASWTVAGLLTLGLGAYVWSFVSTLEDRRANPDPDQVRAHLSSVEPVAAKNDGGVKYDDVRRLFNDMNWTGAVKAPVVEVAPTQVDLKPEVVPIRELVRVLWVQVDLGNPAGSSVFLKYKPKAKVENKGLGGYVLHEGDTLASPHQGIELASITAEGVSFSFTDPERAPETLFPAEFDARAQIVQVGPDGILQPTATGGIPRRVGAPFVPGKTTPLGRDRYRLGTEDLQQASDNYLDILSNDVQLRQHRDPRTGRYDGIEITDVSPGSFAERHGATQGDVVKSINGHAVNSTNEAINFVKINKDKYSTWEVVIENKGKTRTVTYESPDN
jgi:hypothetical protein